MCLTQCAYANIISFTRQTRQLKTIVACHKLVGWSERGGANLIDKINWTDTQIHTLFSHVFKTLIVLFELNTFNIVTNLTRLLILTHSIPPLHGSIFVLLLSQNKIWAIHFFPILIKWPKGIKITWLYTLILWISIFFR